VKSLLDLADAQAGVLGARRALPGRKRPEITA